MSLADANSQRILGNLEASLANVLEGQKEARVAVAKSGERFHGELEMQKRTTDQTFDVIRSGLGELRDRIVKVEIISDTVESHGDAITSIERRLEARDRADKSALDILRNNRRWQKALIGFAGLAAGGAAASGPKFFKWLLTLFHN
jgi:hypothetical protein